MIGRLRKHLLRDYHKTQRLVCWHNRVNGNLLEQKALSLTVSWTEPVDFIIFHPDETQYNNEQEKCGSRVKNGTEVLRFKMKYSESTGKLKSIFQTVVYAIQRQAQFNFGRTYKWQEPVRLTFEHSVLMRLNRKQYGTVG